MPRLWKGVHPPVQAEAAHSQHSQQDLQAQLPILPENIQSAQPAKHTSPHPL